MAITFSGITALSKTSVGAEYTAPPAPAGTVYYYINGTEYTVSNPNANWQFSTNTTTTLNNTVSAVVPGPETNPIYLTDPGDPVFFSFPTLVPAAPSITMEWWQYTTNYVGGNSERVSSFALCEIDPRNIYTSGTALGSRIIAVTYNNTSSVIWGFSGPTNNGIATIAGSGTPSNQWNHYALVYQSGVAGTLTLYINGSLIYSLNGTEVVQKPIVFNYLQILNANTSSISNTVNNNVFVSAVRISSGQRYTGNFTPSQNLTQDGTTIFFTKFSQV